MWKLAFAPVGFACLLIMASAALLATPAHAQKSTRSKAAATRANAGVAITANATDFAPSQQPLATPSPFARVYGTTPAPYGWVQFCQITAAQCQEDARSVARVEATTEHLVELDTVNREVNASVQPQTDLEHYGVDDWWTLPYDGRGDCEDYALQKRHDLMAKGWPASSLLMTVVFDENKEGHAILTARTSKGDYILDNKTDDLKLWYRTPYTYIMRQSYLHVNVWVSLDPRVNDPSIPLSTIIGGNAPGLAR